MPTYSTAIYGADRPMGVAVTADGSRIYVGETEGDRIARVLDAFRQRDRPDAAAAVHRQPSTCRCTWRWTRSSGEVYVTDRPTGADLHLRRRRHLPAHVQPGRRS